MAHYLILTNLQDKENVSPAPKDKESNNEEEEERENEMNRVVTRSRNPALKKR